MFQDISKPLDEWYLKKGDTHQQWLDKYMAAIESCEQKLEEQYKMDMM